MTTKTEWTDITVYWDEQDSENIGWAFRAKTASGHEESGEVSIDGSASLADAVDVACYQLDVELHHSDFGHESDCATYCSVDD